MGRLKIRKRRGVFRLPVVYPIIREVLSFVIMLGKFIRVFVSYSARRGWEYNRTRRTNIMFMN